MKKLDCIKSVKIMLSPTCVEISCSCNDADEVRKVVDEIEELVHSLIERDIELDPDDMTYVKGFLPKLSRDEPSVLCVVNEKKRKMKMYGRTDAALEQAIDAWNKERKCLTAETVDSPTSSGADLKHLPEGFKHELKIPGGLLCKMEKRRGGIQEIIDDMEKEFNLRFKYVRRKHCTMYGPTTDILELAAQTIIHRFVLKSPSENGVVGQLQGKNVVWRFRGSYSKKVNQLLQPELKEVEKIKTVTIKISPSKRNPNLIEVLCSHKKIGTVKTGVEKIVGLVHNLFEKDLTIPGGQADIAVVKEYMKKRYEEDKNVLCLVDESTRQMSVFSRTESVVHQTMAEVRNKLDTSRNDLPDEFV